MKKVLKTINDLALILLVGACRA